MFLVNSRYRLFAETPFRSGRRTFTYQGHTLSRSYGVNLPSSLTRLLSSALVFSTRPPESVWGTVTIQSTQPAAFLGSLASITFDKSLGIVVAFSSYDDCLQTHTGIHPPADLAFSVPALLMEGGAGMFTCFPSTTPFGFALGAD